MMTKLTDRGTIRKFTVISTVLLIMIIAGATSAWAGLHNVAGTNCSAYNNNQANELERSHARLLNPSSNTRSLWVICSLQRVMDHITTGSIIPYVVGFWEAGVTDTINCNYREFDHLTVHIPGVDPDAPHTVDAVAFTINNPGDGSTSAAGFTNVSITAPNTETDNFWTFACQLPPGTGINMFGVTHN